jgi:hypothetical protein
MTRYNNFNAFDKQVGLGRLGPHKPFNKHTMLNGFKQDCVKHCQAYFITIISMATTLGYKKYKTFNLTRVNMQ